MVLRIPSVDGSLRNSRYSAICSAPRDERLMIPPKADTWIWTLSSNASISLKSRMRPLLPLFSDMVSPSQGRETHGERLLRDSCAESVGQGVGDLADNPPPWDSVMALSFGRRSAGC